MVRICNNTYLGGRLREEDHEFEACLSNTVRLCLKKFKKKRKNEPLIKHNMGESQMHVCKEG
jgi:uncharacterized protein (UPF0128 family)